MNKRNKDKKVKDNLADKGINWVITTIIALIIAYIISKYVYPWLIW